MTTKAVSDIINRKYAKACQWGNNGRRQRFMWLKWYIESWRKNTTVKRPDVCIWREEYYSKEARCLQKPYRIFKAPGLYPKNNGGTLIT